MAQGEKQGWWSRNWYWAVPGGCLGCLGLTLGSCALFLGGLFSAVRTSAGFQEILDQIQSHPEVVAALGEPIVAGWVFNGNINLSNSTKTVDMAVPISGPRGKATLFVEGEEASGVWRFERLEVELENGDRIDLLDLPETAPEAVERRVDALSWLDARSVTPPPGPGPRVLPTGMPGL